MAAIEESSHVLAASGSRPLAITWSGDDEGVTVDPKNWKSGRTQAEIESTTRKDLSSNADSILLHSRIAATAAATPAIVEDIQKRRWTFDPTPQGKMGSIQPRPGFARREKISNPPTPDEIAKAPAFLKKNMSSFGPYVSGSLAIGIFQLAQRAGSNEVSAFIAEIKNTQVPTAGGPIPMANWMNANEEWRLFAWFFENWATDRPFPHIKGVTL